MPSKGQELRRNVVEFLTLEDQIPQDHLLRKIDEAVDFMHLYDFVDIGALYSKNQGRPSIDPVVPFKIVLLEHLDGIPSLRGTLRRAQTDIAYRWFLGYTLNEELPHFSTVSYNFRRRYTEETVEQIFRWILWEANQAGALTPGAVFLDGTHINANANVNKKIKQDLKKEAGAAEEGRLQNGDEKHNRSGLWKVFNDSRVLSAAYKRPMTMKGGHETVTGNLAATRRSVPMPHLQRSGPGLQMGEA